MSFMMVASGLFRRQKREHSDVNEPIMQVRPATKAERELAIHTVHERLRGFGYVPQTTCGGSTLRQMHRTRGD